MIRKAYLYFSFPALFLHELSHLVMCFLTLTVPFGFRLNLINGLVKYDVPKNTIVNFLINMSPFLNFLIVLVLAFLHTAFFVIFIYLLLTYKVSLPSEIDYHNVRNFRKVK